jgi:hypothetical protein
MVEKPEYIALIQPVAGLPEAEQRRIVAKFEPSDYFLIGKDGDHDAYIKIMRPPRVALVSHAALLGEQRGKKHDRQDSMAGTKAALHKRGSHAVEASTGRSSLKKWAAMRKDGCEMCRRLSQGAKSALNGRKGTTPLADRYDLTALRDLLRVKVSTKYKNWRQRRAAIVRLEIKPVPGRTWFLQHLETHCRRRGILE